MRAFERFAPEDGLPVSEALSQRVLSLPMHPYLTDEQAHYVVDRLVVALAEGQNGAAWRQP